MTFLNNRIKIKVGQTRVTMQSEKMGFRKEDKRAYSQSRTVLGNLGILLWIVLGTGAIWFFDPVLAYVFLFLTVLFIFAVVRKSLCKTCAYCKTCTAGFGKLPEFVFGKAELGGIRPRTLLELLVVFYGLLAVVPTGLLTVSISQEYALSKIAVLASLLLILFYSVSTKRKREFMRN